MLAQIRRDSKPDSNPVSKPGSGPTQPTAPASLCGILD